MSKQTRDSRGRYASDWKRAERLLALSLLLAVVWWHVHDATQAEADKLDTLQAQHVELLNRYSALEHEAAINSNTIQEPERWRVKHEAELTAYSCEGIKSEADRFMNCPNGITATGTVPAAGRTVACPPRLIGKTITIEGIGKRVCEDTGGAIVSNKIDVYVADVDTALAFGVQQKTYTIND